MDSDSPSKVIHTSGFSSPSSQFGQQASHLCSSSTTNTKKMKIETNLDKPLY
jgi:hypothetical protein